MVIGNAFFYQARGVLPDTEGCPFTIAFIKINTQGDLNLARSNYSFKKRQKELAKKKKREEKIQRKHSKNSDTIEEDPNQLQDKEENL